MQRLWKQGAIWPVAWSTSTKTWCAPVWSAIPPRGLSAATIRFKFPERKMSSSTMRGCKRCLDWVATTRSSAAIRNGWILIWQTGKPPTMKNGPKALPSGAGLLSSVLKSCSAFGPRAEKLPRVRRDINFAIPCLVMAILLISKTTIWDLRIPFH